VGVFGVGQKITDRKNAEAEQNRLAQDLVMLIDNANAPIFGIDKEGRVNEWNRKVGRCRLTTGWPRVDRAWF
jgi:PAS domain-containing protein